MGKKIYKLSIIVPVYNVEKYISRCANSIINQTIDVDKYEIIFVDDGTKDKSIEVLKEIIDFSQFPNCKIVHKSNGGLSSARNFGIDNSSGEYLWFVDSDDWIEPNAVELLISLSKQSPDIIFTSQMYKNVGDKQTLKYSRTLNQSLRGVDVLNHYPPSCAVAYICKKSFLEKNSFRFKEGICFEDSELTPKMLYMAQSVVSTDVPLYHHYMRDDSITHTISKRSIDDYKIVLTNHVFFYNNVVKLKDKKIYASNISSKILTILYFSYLAFGRTNKDLDRFIKNSKELREMLCLCSYKPIHYFGQLVRLFPSNVTLIYYIFRILKGKNTSLG